VQFILMMLWNYSVVIRLILLAKAFELQAVDMVHYQFNGMFEHNRSFLMYMRKFEYNGLAWWY